jgi:hypothetical protein
MQNKNSKQLFFLEIFHFEHEKSTNIFHHCFSPFFSNTYFLFLLHFFIDFLHLVYVLAVMLFLWLFSMTDEGAMIT